MYTRVLSGVRSMRVMLEILPERALKGGLSIVCALSMPDNTSKMQNKVAVSYTHLRAHET